MTGLLVDVQGERGEKLLRLPLGRHQRETRGDAIARLTSDTAIANRLQSQIFGDVLEDAGVVIIALVGAVWLAWQLALALFAIRPPIALALANLVSRHRTAS